MSAHATDLARRARAGSALLGVLVILVGLLGLLYAAGTVSRIEVEESRQAFDDVRAKYLAEAGVERGILYLADAVKKTSVHDPLNGLAELFADSPTFTPLVGEPVLNDTAQVGAYTVSLSALEQSATSITIAIDSTGYVADAPSGLGGERVDSWRAVRATVRFSLAPSAVFDYGYFINNWGWFYGSTIHCNGNVRSNGQFDAAGYSPIVTGQPLYDEVSWDGVSAALSGYRDDNGDGLTDGNDGGIFSGWDIVGAENVQGNGGMASNQHEFESPVPMPNLSDLSQYETSASQQAGTISIGGVEVSDAVYGDEASEHQHLYLVGTPANPIVIDGPVVVRGDVIISGTITGQGAIYSGGNVYCPQSVSYLNPPTSPRPAGNAQSDSEAWLSSNWNKDFLGLFARENVVIGDFNDSIWQYYENWWMSDPLNSSVEDAGADGIPNTRAGRDGILGTADDDLLEGDGVFSVEHYSEADAALGLIPEGKSIGDPINGTGEDIDGDGVYDDGTTLADVILSTPLDTAHWGGNMPAAGIANYSSISSLYASNLDAIFYTNHSFCYVVLGDAIARINGALVSRNENIIYGTPSVEINHDARLLGGSSGKAARFLPQTIQPIEVLRWVTLERDPNRYVVAP